MLPGDKLMHVDSRLNNVLLANDFEFPAILPAHCYVAKLMVIHFQEESLKQWLIWLLSLQELVGFKVPRCYKHLGFGAVVNVQLHMFADTAHSPYSRLVYDVF